METTRTMTLPRPRDEVKTPRNLLWLPAFDRFLPLPQGRFTLGKAPDCHVVIEDPTVSRYHCEGEYRDGTLRLWDRDSRNGLRFRGRLVRELTLVPGEIASLGHQPLCLTGAPRPRSRGDLITRDPAFASLLDDMVPLARHDLSILVSGETGTGKELSARLLHDQSPRSRGPYFAVNCGAIPRELIESELFGHERGAFSGASQRREGILSQANGGTLFLDEIAELRPDHQSSLLRFLETGTYRPVGSDLHRQADIRVICATHKDLHEQAREGRFRRDLLYRLSQLMVTLMPLRDRILDIPLLIERFGAPTPPPALLGEILELHFEGNVRELKSLCQIARTFGWEKTKQHYCPAWALASSTEATKEASLFESIQMDAITETLGETDGNISAAARLLGLPRTTLINKMKRMGMR